MKKGRLIYNLINLIVLALSVGLFVYTYVLSDKLSHILDSTFLPLVILSVLLVHTVKAIRLYLALYGLDMKRSACMKLYCKVTPVSVLLPWKLGEFFRMYCCGSELNSLSKGVVIILLDRFFDTMALVCMIMLMCLFLGGTLPVIVYGFLIFLILVFLIYLAFPGIYEVWKKYLLSSKATENKILSLKFLDALNRIYREVKGVLKGRGSLLYILSMLAWGAEIGSLYLIHASDADPSGVISAYLSAAMGIGTSDDLQRFVIFTILLLICAYALLKLFESAFAKRSKE